jgi:O-acetyl-ADP-ribose deacetylase (regulator of RNase III)
MIVECSGDIFERAAEGAVLVNPVNCVGVSGKGLAKEFKRRFPKQQRQYECLCGIGHVRPGKVLFFDPVVYFPTKNHWRNPSEIDWIRDGLIDLREFIELEHNIGRSLAVPALGCGLGGLSWSDVLPLIYKHLGDMPHRDVWLYPPR